jgi:hypothetical protein
MKKSLVNQGSAFTRSQLVNHAFLRRFEGSHAITDGDPDGSRVIQDQKG